VKDEMKPGRIVVESEPNVKTPQGGHSKKQFQSQIEARTNKGHHGNKGRMNYSEESIADFIDNKRFFERMAPHIEALQAGDIDVKEFITRASPSAAMQLAKLAFSSESEKTMLEALKYMLGIEGHVPTQRHEIGRIDPDTPKAAIISQIAGMNKEFAASGIEIVDDRDDSDED
jgi:hypothetical protein